MYTHVCIYMSMCIPHCVCVTWYNSQWKQCIHLHAWLTYCDVSNHTRYGIWWSGRSNGRWGKDISFIPHAQLVTSHRPWPSWPRHCTEHRLHSTHHKIQVRIPQEISHSLVYPLTHSLPSLTMTCLCTIICKPIIQCTCHCTYVHHTSSQSPQQPLLCVYCALRELSHGTVLVFSHCAPWEVGDVGVIYMFVFSV